MNVFVRAVITGFGYSLGAALYKKVSKRFNEDNADATSDKPEASEAVPQPSGSGESREPGEPGGDADSPEAQPERSPR